MTRGSLSSTGETVFVNPRIVASSEDKDEDDFGGISCAVGVVGISGAKRRGGKCGKARLVETIQLRM